MKKHWKVQRQRGGMSLVFMDGAARTHDWCTVGDLWEVPIVTEGQHLALYSFPLYF